MNTQAPTHSQVEQATKLLLPIVPDCTERTGLGRSTLYGFIRSGELTTVKVGSRRLVPAAELERFVAGLVESQR